MPVTTIQYEGWLVKVDDQRTVPTWLIDRLVTEAWYVWLTSGPPCSLISRKPARGPRRRFDDTIVEGIAHRSRVNIEVLHYKLGVLFDLRHPHELPIEIHVASGRLRWFGEQPMFALEHKRTSAQVSGKAGRVS